MWHVSKVEWNVQHTLYVYNLVPGGDQCPLSNVVGLKEEISKCLIVFGI